MHMYKFGTVCYNIHSQLYMSKPWYLHSANYFFFCDSGLSAWSYKGVLLQVNGGRMEPKPSPNRLVQYGTKCKFSSLFCKHLHMTFA